jgi:hypothetical protein
VSALTALLTTASVHATVFTFNLTGAADDSAIPNDYGNRATSPPSNPNYGYGNFGEGFTPNAVATYNQPAFFFSTGYGALTNIAYASGGVFSLTLAADPGFTVSLLSFDMAGFDSNYNINSVSVTGGTTSFNQTNVVIAGSNNGTGSTPFDFTGSPITGSQFTIQFDATNLGSGLQANVGIDNIRIRQAVVPEPSVTIIGLALTGVALAVRRRFF